MQSHQAALQGLQDGIQICIVCEGTGVPLSGLLVDAEKCKSFCSVSQQESGCLHQIYLLIMPLWLSPVIISLPEFILMPLLPTVVSVSNLFSQS